MKNHLNQILLLMAFGCCSYFAAAQPQSNFFFELPNGNNNFCVPLVVEFTNASKAHDPVYTWTINGQISGEEEDFQWIFLEAGIYQVCLEVREKDKRHRNCQGLQFFAPQAVPLEAALTLSSEL